MARLMAKEDPNYKVVAENRRARFDYAIESDLECGIQLVGSEVKSLRTGQANIAESYAAVEGGELWLDQQLHRPLRPWPHLRARGPAQAQAAGFEARALQPLERSQRKGMTLVPLVLYFNHRGIAKLKIGVARGKKLADKRETAAKRDWQRQKQRLLKEHG